MALPNSEVSSFEKPSLDAMGQVSFEDPSPDPMEEEEEDDDEEAQALYDALQKKLAMSLDDLIKMSKKDAASNGNSRRRRHHPRRRRPNKAPSAGNALHQGNDGRVEQYMDARYIIRQRVLARRRSIPATTDQFPAVGGTSDAGRDQVQISTTDALFATMKQLRMRAHSQSQHQRASQRGRRRDWWLGGNGPFAPNATVLQRSVKFFG